MSGIKVDLKERLSDILDIEVDKIEKDSINPFDIWKIGERKEEKVSELIDKSDEIEEMMNKILSFSGTERLGCVETDYEIIPVLRVPDNFQKLKDIITGDEELPCVDNFSFFLVDENDEFVSMVVIITQTKDYPPSYLSEDFKDKYVKNKNKVRTKYFDDGLIDGWKGDSNFYEMNDVKYGQYVYMCWDSKKIG